MTNTNAEEQLNKAIEDIENFYWDENVSKAIEEAKDVFLKWHEQEMEKGKKRVNKLTKEMDEVILEIEYVDSGIIDEQTESIAYVHNVCAVGFLVHEDDESITIAREYDKDENNWRGQLAIPKASIINRYYVE